MKPHKYGRLVAEVGSAQPSAEGWPAVGPTYRNVVATEGYATLEGVRTLYELFQSSAEKYAENPCLGHRPEVRPSCWPGAYIDAVRDPGRRLMADAGGWQGRAVRVADLPASGGPGGEGGVGPGVDRPGAPRQGCGLWLQLARVDDGHDGD